MVDENIRDGAEGQGGQHIHGGVLLQKERREADSSGRQGAGGLPAPAPEAAAVPQAEVRRQGSHHVEGRADIRIGVKDIEPGGEAGQGIVPGEDLGPQVLAVGEDQVDEHRHPVGEDEEPHHPPEGRDIPEVGVGHRPAKIDKPEEVRHHGPLPEGDKVVQGAVGGEILGVLWPQPLQGHEDQLKDGPEEQELRLRCPELLPEPGPESRLRGEEIFRIFKGIHGETSVQCGLRQEPVS